MKSIFSNNNKVKVSDKFKSLLSNQGVLYFIFALAIGNLFYLGTSNDVMTIAVFVLTGFLTSFFSKNMIVILCVSLVVSSIIKHGISYQTAEGFSFSEGLTDDDKEKVRAAVEGLLGDSKNKKDKDEISNTKIDTSESKGNNKPKGNTVGNSEKIDADVPP